MLRIRGFDHSSHAELLPEPLAVFAVAVLQLVMVRIVGDNVNVASAKVPCPPGSGICSLLRNQVLSTV